MICEGEIKGVITKRWSARARSYDCSPGHGIHSEVEKQTWLKILAGALDKKKNLKILDAGTGTGALALLLAEMGHDVFGIDLSDQMLKRAGEKAKAKDLQVTFKVGDAENPPFAPKSFDAIVSRHVLWTLPNPEKAVRAWKELLKPGGHLVIIDGNFKYMTQKTLFQEAWRFLAMPLVVVTEFRDPRMPGKDLDEKLPMRHRERPEADLEMLRDVGFKADVSKVSLQRKLSPLRYLKYGYSRHSEHQFVVKGVKPV
ncbi:MAG: class I SAM-dependent methyltransferase [Pseudomonadota bacterium]